jgi:putative transposase
LEWPYEHRRRKVGTRWGWPPLKIPFSQHRLQNWVNSRERHQGSEISREQGISEATYYIWKKKYSGLGLNELRELRQLREENGKLKRLIADLPLDWHILQEIVQKKL